MGRNFRFPFLFASFLFVFAGCPDWEFVLDGLDGITIDGSSSGGEGETSGGEDENPSPEPEIPLPEKVYIQVRFDLHDDSGGLYKSAQYREMRQLDYQYDALGTSGTLIDGRATYPPSYYFPYGFIVKYGGGPGASNERIARYDSGIDHYVGHEGLWVKPQRTGTAGASVYLIFSFGDQIVYDRSTQQFVIPWDRYDPSVHTDKALFYISVVNGSWSVTFDGFAEKNPSDLP